VSVTLDRDSARARRTGASRLIERFFGYVSADRLQRSEHRSVQGLEADIRKGVKAWNANPKPFVWTNTAEQILSSLGRLIQRTSNPVD